MRLYLRRPTMSFFFYIFSLRYNDGQFQDNYIATVGVDFIVKETETKNGDRVKVEVRIYL